MISQFFSTLTDAATPLRFTLLNQQLAQLSQFVGVPVDQLRCVTCLLAAYPLAIVVRKVPNVATKHWLHICAGVSIAQFVYGTGWLHSLVSSLLTYAMVCVLPHKTAPLVVFLANMLFVAALHLHRMRVNYMGWSMDSTASQMLLLIRLTSFAFNYHDGVVANATTVKDGDSEHMKMVKQSRKQLAIPKIPSLLEFLGFVYCFTTFLAGPAFEYKEYSDAIHRTRFVDRNGVRRNISPTYAALSKLALGLGLMGLFVRFGAFAALNEILNDDDQSMLLKWGRLLIALFLTRAKYYLAWKLAEGATVLTGTGFEGFDEQNNPKGWDGVSNVDIIGFELGANVREISRAWNKGTQNWLERYVYTRTGNSLLATYLVSALWHGFYPGYYLFFLTVPLATAVNRLARRHVRPYVVDSPIKPLYDVFGMICTAMVVNYLAVSFVVLSWEDAVAGFRSMRFAGHLGLVVCYLLLTFVPIKKSPNSKKII
ncbi:lysophospholipid acyltransferase [Plasmopara halstedii]|uniref:Lysophospholipid acyltransferase n=1 Tax=Plasmopara halstedii TaxID=4781 RepID=A0A0P1AIN4_PLAHL|nr:lysophospholipid acyltransferase [Plasmopara halstedii]CEG40878.1 lysophospholipid acyltransferase [Plasmopara halstedii]|eukprot:XP_024577247.1 lysophospholipid acyltransferase [Plasmopara halstedii]